MKTLIVGLIVSIGCLLPALAWSQSSLESPIGFVSGLGDVHGWICSAGNLTFTIDNGPPGALIYGASRGDTQGVCGDSNNGFITQFNWNLVGSGQHTIRVFNNGQQFAQSTFTVTTLGTDFLTGAASSCSTTIAGQNVTLTWQQNLQNYVITGAGAGANFPSVAGDWFVSLDFLTEDCNFISVPPDLPTHF